MKTRLSLVGGALAVTAALAAAAPLAQAAPKCKGTTAAVVHGVEEAVAGAPVVGQTAAGVIHNGVEDAACLLP